MNHQTLQFFTNVASLRYLIPGVEQSLQGGQKLKEIENKPGCSVKVTKYSREQNRILVSIIGHQERLNEASSPIAGPSLVWTCFRA